MKLILILVTLGTFTLASCNTVGGFTRGVVDDVKSIVPGIWN